MAFTRTLAGLARACHLEPTLAVTAGATILAVAMRRDAPGVANVAAVVLASQLAAGWHNDWLDSERDLATGRRGKPIPQGAVPRRVVGIGAAIAAVATVALAAPTGAAAALVAAVGVAGGLLYNWPLKFTALSVLPYAVSFAAVPVYVLLGRPGVGAPPVWLVAAGATLGAGAHFANVLPDLADDGATGVHGLPYRIGPRRTAMAAAGLLAVTGALLVWGPPGAAAPLAIAGGIAAVGVLLLGWYLESRRPGSRLLFRAVMVAALIDIALLLAAGPRL